MKLLSTNGIKYKKEHSAEVDHGIYIKDNKKNVNSILFFLKNKNKKDASIIIDTQAEIKNLIGVVNNGSKQGIHNRHYHLEITSSPDGEVISKSLIRENKQNIDSDSDDESKNKFYRMQSTF